MVDLKAQYAQHKYEIDQAIAEVINETTFINGLYVEKFTDALGSYLNSQVVGVANGTDALQIALMSLDLKPGDEVIVPAFTYVATAEVIALLGLKPVMVDVDYDTFNIDVEEIRKSITERTKAIVPVNLFGQSADINAIMQIAQEFNLTVIEDNAQSLGSIVEDSNGTIVKSGTIGHIACTSFYPSKILGAYGDGGAIYSNNEALLRKIKMIANHGQTQKYIHTIIGCNSRLDAIQANILNVKLKYLDKENKIRNKIAHAYRERLSDVEGVNLPTHISYGSHVYHQFTIKVSPDKRDKLKEELSKEGVPTMIYYPLPLYKQRAFRDLQQNFDILPITEKLCASVISLPIHPYLTIENIDFITSKIKNYVV